MSAVKHTPGPWREFMGDICASDDEIVICAMNKSCGARSSEFYTYSGKKEVARANARLIAAAPDLLEALKEAREHISMSAPDWHVRTQEMLAALDAAIAKAEGAA